jgi:hypothetical protein
MTGGDPAADSGGPDLQALARDWITLWQSELAAMAADREAQETWRSLLAIWAAASANLLKSLPKGGADAGGGRPQPAPRATPAAAAPDARDAEIERLARHIGELERRLAELERGRAEPGRKPRGRARRT